jgi:hypothetical protein
VVESDGLIVRLLIVWPWPSKIVLSGALGLPSGAKFATELASMSLPSAYAFGLVTAVLTICRSLAVFTSM